MDPIPIYQVDAFTSRPFSGNPAAVCVLNEPCPDEWMLSLAGEMNLSETAFLLPERDGWRLRWFTPAVEVSLCGHATLASAHVLWESGRLDMADPARFYSLSGLLGARLDQGWIELDFPSQPPRPATPPPGLLDALGASPVGTLASEGMFLVEVSTEAEVREARPDFDRLKDVEILGAILTARSGEAGLDFVSRFFAPSLGINEDPVTGAAHTRLTPYWAAKLGRNQLNARQVSRRGGDLRLKLYGERVGIAGQAVTVFRGELSGRVA